jgi:hypothetical protein
MLVMTPELVKLERKLQHLMERSDTALYKDEYNLLQGLIETVQTMIEDIVINQLEEKEAI